MKGRNSKEAFNPSLQRDWKDDLQTTESAEAFFSDKIFDDNLLNEQAVDKMKDSHLASAHLKERLKQVIAEQLTGGLKVPEVIEGLAEFLADLVGENPEQARRFGIVK